MVFDFLNGQLSTQFNVIQVYDVENATGGNASDTIAGNDLANTLDGGAGGDDLYGRGGADRLIGGDGFDLAGYNFSGLGVSVSLALTGAQNSPGTEAHGDVLIGIEGLVGSNHADTLTGNALDNTLVGNNGNDVLIGGKGADNLYGGADSDTASYATSSAGVTVWLDFNLIQGGDAQGDLLDSIENLIGSAYADLLNGNSSSNTLDGGGGNDVLRDHGSGDLLRGGSGNDSLWVFYNGNTAEGGTGNDKLNAGGGTQYLYGNDGSDVIDSGMGSDAIYGGTGRDRFIYSDGYDYDYIYDFQAGSKGDYLDLRGISNLTYYQQLFTPGVLSQVGTDVLVDLGYFNGDADDKIWLENTTVGSLRPINFILN